MPFFYRQRAPSFAGKAFAVPRKTGPDTNGAVFQHANKKFTPNAFKSILA